jgi:ubiquinone/menaquinone biosynthesis C-methylase UbiE
MTGDSEKMPFAAHSFDIVTCSASFHHYPHPINVLKEIERVLKKNGLFILCDTHIIAPLRLLANIFIKFGNSGDVHLYSKKEINKLYTAVGLKPIKWQVIPHYAFIYTGQKKGNL